MIAQAILSSATPVRVDDARDWLDYVAVWSGAGGALLAALAIVYAAWQSVQTKKDLLRERRLEFELGLLAKIHRQLSITQFQHLSGYVGALIRDADDETDIPLLRAVTGTKSGPVGQHLRDKIGEAAKTSSTDPQVEWLTLATAEVDAAIERRLKV